MLTPDLVPPRARACYVRVDPDQADLTNFYNLHPLEKTLAARAVDSRKAELGDARWCAHQALYELGASEDAPILRGERGMPLWPAGFVGTMTHTRGLRAAVAARSHDYASLGLDAEPAEPLPEGVLHMVARASELPQLSELLQRGVRSPDRLLFCAKEATYKAWFPLTHQWLDFGEADIDLRPDGTVISYLLTRPAPVPFIEGRWAEKDGYVAVLLAIPASAVPTAA